MDLPLNQTNLVVSLGFLGDPVAGAGTVSPVVTGTDTSVFRHSSFRQGVVPPISENEWLEAWSAVVEFAVLFRAPFLTQATSVSPWGWVIPPDFEEQSTDSEARLWVPSVRQMSRFLLRDFVSETRNSPTTPGGWVRRMETYLSGVIKEDAYVPFTLQLLLKYDVPITGITLTSPEEIGTLFQAGEGGFLGSFALSGPTLAAHDVTLLENRAGNNITGLTANRSRCIFVPSFASGGLVSLLDLGLTSQQTSLLDASWVPAADPEVHLAPESASLDLAITDDSVLRMAFGGDAPSDAVFEGLLRGTVTAPATLNAPFMSSPLSLLFFAKSLIWNIADIRTYQDEENPSHSYGKALFATETPADPEVPGSQPTITYTPATVRIPGQKKSYDDEYIKYEETGHEIIVDEGTKCVENVAVPFDDGYVIDLASPYNREEGNPDAPYEGGLAALYEEAKATGAVTLVEHERTFGMTLVTRVDTYVYSQASTSSDTDGGPCGQSEWASVYSSDLLHEYDNAHKWCEALAEVPVAAFPTDTGDSPWTSTVFDLLKGAIGEAELAFLAGNNLLGVVQLYISVWCPGVSAPSGGQTHTYLEEYGTHVVDGSVVEWGPEVTSETASGYPKTPVESAQAFLEPVLANLTITESFPPLSELVAQCENGTGEFEDADSPPIDNSISVDGLGTFAHRSILLWEGTDLQEELSEATLWGTIVEEVGLIPAIEAISTLPPSVSTSTITIRGDPNSGSVGATGSFSTTGPIMDSTSTRTSAGATLRFAMGDLYFRAEYNFTHYRNL